MRQRSLLMASPSSTSRILSPKPKRFRLIILIPTFVGSPDSDDTDFCERSLEIARQCLGLVVTTGARSAWFTPKNWDNFVICLLRSWKSVPRLATDGVSTNTFVQPSHVGTEGTQSEVDDAVESARLRERSAVPRLSTWIS